MTNYSIQLTIMIWDPLSLVYLVYNNPVIKYSWTVIFVSRIKKFERLGGPLGEIVTISADKYNVMMQDYDIILFERHVAKTLAALIS